jgi:uncharacterized membrane protein YhaH (DUF805 family)
VEWFVGRDGQSFGPFEFRILVDAAQRGELRQDDLVWRSGMNDWCQASTISALWRPVQPRISRFAKASRLPITLKHLLLPWGRTNRRSFWGLLISAYLAGRSGLHIMYVQWPAYLSAAFSMFYLMLAYTLIVGVIGRLHDHNRTGWYAIVYAVPVTSAAVYIWLTGITIEWQQYLLRIGSVAALTTVFAMVIHIGAMRGTIGTNRFGPDPAEGEHTDDYFSRARFVSVLGPPWVPVLTVLGQTWVALRRFMDKIGARNIAIAMKLFEERYEQGVQQNLELAEQRGWNRVLYWHGRSQPDPCVHSPTPASIIADIIVAAVIISPIGFAAGVAMFEAGKFSASTSILTAAATSVVAAVGLLVWRIKKARAAKITFMEMEGVQVNPVGAVPSSQPGSATSESVVAATDNKALDPWPPHHIATVIIIAWIGWAYLGVDLGRVRLDITNTLAITIHWREKLRARDRCDGK